ncbi:hypothetical protein A3Q56_04674 [Intoshia linei]|uniref:Calpain catalytic domain-containing protein n=1 Tax=Intoshia linei TaxID=1819745 RepID=A0A177B0F0_9BILA|nr:hypothetical protein A3Q56_04674 [Intoshia linei]
MQQKIQIQGDDFTPKAYKDDFKPFTDVTYIKRNSRYSRYPSGWSMSFVEYKYNDYEALEKYKLISAECMVKKTLYEDPTFKIKQNLPKNILHKNIKFMRPHELCDNPKMTEGGIDIKNVQLGSLGTYWVLSSITNLDECMSNTTNINAELGKSVNGVFDKNITESYCGALVFVFHWIDTKCSVVIDDRIPVYDENEKNKGKMRKKKSKPVYKPLYLHSKIGNEFWMCLLEKALMAMHGKYQYIHNGQTKYYNHMLSGQLYFNISANDLIAKCMGYKVRNMDDSKMLNTLKSYGVSVQPSISDNYNFESLHYVLNYLKQAIDENFIVFGGKFIKEYQEIIHEEEKYGILKTGIAYQINRIIPAEIDGKILYIIGVKNPLIESLIIDDDLSETNNGHNDNIWSKLSSHIQVLFKDIPKQSRYQLFPHYKFFLYMDQIQLTQYKMEYQINKTVSFLPERSNGGNICLKTYYLNPRFELTVKENNGSIIIIYFNQLRSRDEKKKFTSTPISLHVFPYQSENDTYSLENNIYVENYSNDSINEYLCMLPKGRYVVICSIWQPTFCGDAIIQIQSGYGINFVEYSPKTAIEICPDLMKDIKMTGTFENQLKIDFAKMFTNRHYIGANELGIFLKRLDILKKKYMQEDITKITKSLIDEHACGMHSCVSEDEIIKICRSLKLACSILEKQKFSPNGLKMYEYREALQEYGIYMSHGLFGKLSKIYQNQYGRIDYNVGIECLCRLFHVTSKNINLNKNTKNIYNVNQCFSTIFPLDTFTTFSDRTDSISLNFNKFMILSL